MEIKKVTLSPEYTYFFGKRLSNFKYAYQIKFDAKDIEENSLITPDVSSISLVFRSIEKNVTLTWDVAPVNPVGIQ